MYTEWIIMKYVVEKSNLGHLFITDLFLNSFFQLNLEHIEQLRETQRQKKHSEKKSKI